MDGWAPRSIEPIVQQQTGLATKTAKTTAITLPNKRTSRE